MSIDVHEADGVVVIRPNQARIIAASGESALGSALAKAIDDGRLAIALDLAGVEYADNAVIGGLVDAVKQMSRDGGTLCAFGLTPALGEFFRQTVLDRLVEIHATEADTILSCANRPKRRKQSVWQKLFT